jgi:hypothetical protein
MVSGLGWGSWTRHVAACLVAITVLLSGLPVPSLCCGSTSPCCSVGMDPAGAQTLKLDAGKRDCCQPVISVQPCSYVWNLAPLPHGPEMAILPPSMSSVGEQPSEAQLPASADDLRPDPPPTRRASRAPPLS